MKKNCAQLEGAKMLGVVQQLSHPIAKLFDRPNDTIRQVLLINAPDFRVIDSPLNVVT